MRERPPGFMLVPGALLRDHVFAALPPAARGAYLTAMLYLWEAGSLPEVELAALSGTGRDWPAIRDALAPLFCKRGGRWSLSWLSRYADRVTHLQESGASGAASTNLKRKPLRESADGTTPTASSALMPTRSGSGSGSRPKRTEAGAPPPPSPHSRPAPAFRPGLIQELQALHPSRDVAEIAAKVLERHADEPFRSLNGALRSWVRVAVEKDIDRCIAPTPAQAGADVIARIEADQQQSLRDQAADPGAAERAKAAVDLLVNGVVDARAMEGGGGG